MSRVQEEPFKSHLLSDTSLLREINAFLEPGGMEEVKSYFFFGLYCLYSK